MGLGLLCCTWNVCGLTPSGDATQSLRAWLDGASDADVVLIGLVEVVELSPMNVVRDSVMNSTDRGVRVAAWRVAVSGVLGDDFECVAEDGLVGVALFVFVRKGGETRVVEARTTRVSTGFIGGALGNKGAAVARLRLARNSAERTLCIVHAQLSSDLEQRAVRDAEYAQIVSTPLAFVASEASCEEVAAPAVSTLGLFSAAVAPPCSLLDHDLVVWMGDLNSRLDDPPRLVPRPRQSVGDKLSAYIFSLEYTFPGFAPSAPWSTPGTSEYIFSGEYTFPRFAPSAPWSTPGTPVSPVSPPPLPPPRPEAEVFAEIAGKIDRREWSALYAMDQLAASIRDGLAFDGFREAPITFPPTYKLVRGAREYKTNRRPAWCDRVLWRSKMTDDLHPKFYRSVSDCTLSDHHPVQAALQWAAF